MDCHDARERLLEGRESAGVRRHLIRCADCASLRRELEDGGREISETFLEGAPSPGFEERVSARLAEEEITVPIPIRTGSRFAWFLVPAAAVLFAVVAWKLFDTRPAPAPAVKPEPRPAAARPAAVTVPVADNVLTVTLRREQTAGPTLMDGEFAGVERNVTFPTGVEDYLFLAWAQGAREVLIVVAPEVPTRELWSVMEVLERAGYSWAMRRPKDLPPLR